MLRKVVSFVYCGASRYTGYQDKSIRLDLECGHDQFRKASAGVPKRAKCNLCAYEWEQKLKKVFGKDVKEQGNP